MHKSQPDLVIGWGVRTQNKGEQRGEEDGRIGKATHFPTVFAAL